MTDFSWTQDRDKCSELFSRYTALRKATQTFMSERFYKKISARDMESTADRLEIDTHGKAFVFDSENDMTVMFDYALFLNDENGGPVVQRESPKLAKGADAATRELLDVFSNPRASSVALLAWAETDLYFYLGHCLVRLFPRAFAHYAIPDEYMINFENALFGHMSGADARDTKYAPIFYVSGFWLAVANIESPIFSIEPTSLKRRYNRRVDFMGLESSI